MKDASVRFGYFLFAISVFVVVITFEQTEPPAVLAVRERDSEPVAARGRRERFDAPRAVQELLSIESRWLPPALVDGEASHRTLPDYYWAGNQALLTRFKHVNQLFDNASTRKVQALTLVAGTAGVGKTFLKSQVVDKEVTGLRRSKIDLVKVYAQWAKQGLVEQHPDLATGDVVINRLPRVRDRSTPLVASFLADQNADCYIVDSLDEVHADDYDWILNQIHDFVASSQRDFIHVAVFGRGFAFRDFCRRKNYPDSLVDIELLALQPPQFRTTGDLLVSSWNYYTWANHLRWSPSAGDAEPMTLQAFREWAAGGFVRKGDFASVTFDPVEAINPQAYATMIRWAQEQRAVCSILGNLAGNGMIRELANRHVSQPFDETSIMRDYLEARLVRASRVVGRPSSVRSDLVDLYRRLLEQVAVDVVRRGRVRSDGSFLLSPEDSVVVTWNARELRFLVTAILDHSGLASSDPVAESEQLKYRFEPIGFHRLLVEMHMQRRQSKPMERDPPVAKARLEFALPTFPAAMTCEPVSAGVDSKSNEITAIPQLLELQGAIVSIDAMDQADDKTVVAKVRHRTTREKSRGLVLRLLVAT